MTVALVVLSLASLLIHLTADSTAWSERTRALLWLLQFGLLCALFLVAQQLQLSAVP